MYYDCPGFGDTRTFNQEIVNAFYIKKIFDSTSEVKILLCIDINDFKNSRG